MKGGVEAHWVERSLRRELEKHHLTLGAQRWLSGEQRFMRVGVGAAPSLRIDMVQSHLEIPVTYGDAGKWGES
jgi:hypothetical protein